MSKPPTVTPSWDRKRTQWEWLRWWYSVPEDDKRRFEKAAWPEENEGMVAEPPTLNERLEWTYEELLQLRVSMRHLAKQLPGREAEIGMWAYQLGDMVGGVQNMQAVRRLEVKVPGLVPGLVGEFEKGPIQYPEPFPGTEEK